MTRKIVSEMTYNVSMGTLNPTIPYHTISQMLCDLLKLGYMHTDVCEAVLEAHPSFAVDLSGRYILSSSSLLGTFTVNLYLVLVCVQLGF